MSDLLCQHPSRCQPEKHDSQHSRGTPDRCPSQHIRRIMHPQIDATDRDNRCHHDQKWPSETHFPAEEPTQVGCQGKEIGSMGRGKSVRSAAPPTSIPEQDLQMLLMAGSRPGNQWLEDPRGQLIGNQENRNRNHQCPKQFSLAALPINQSGKHHIQWYPNPAIAHRHHQRIQPRSMTPVDRQEQLLIPQKQSIHQYFNAIRTSCATMSKPANPSTAYPSLGFERRCNP